MLSRIAIHCCWSRNGEHRYTDGRRSDFDRNDRNDRKNDLGRGASGVVGPRMDGRKIGPERSRSSSEAPTFPDRSNRFAFTTKPTAASRAVPGDAPSSSFEACSLFEPVHWVSPITADDNPRATAWNFTTLLSVELRVEVHCPRACVYRAEGQG